MPSSAIPGSAVLRRTAAYVVAANGSPTLVTVVNSTDRGLSSHLNIDNSSMDPTVLNGLKFTTRSSEDQHLLYEPYPHRTAARETS